MCNVDIAIPSREAVMRTSFVLAALFTVGCKTALAQDVGDSEAGHEIGAQICAPCHAIEPGEGTMANPPPLPFEAEVPLPFEDIANTPGISATALFAWMRTSHPSMPNIVLEGEDLPNLVAYILSLRREPYRP